MNAPDFNFVILKLNKIIGDTTEKNIQQRQKMQYKKCNGFSQKHLTSLYK